MPDRDSSAGAAGFITVKSRQMRASLVLVAGIAVLLITAVNLLTVPFGGHSRERCTYDDFNAGYRCGRAWSLDGRLLAYTVIGVTVYLAVAYMFSARAALRLSGCRPADGPEYSQLRGVVEEAALAAGLPVPKVYVVDDPAPNAFATGRSPAKAAITVTTGLLATMSRRELRGVVAHEMGHIKNRDIAVTTFAVLAVAAIAVLAQLVVRGALSVSRSRDGGQIALLLAAVGALLFIFAVPAGLLLKAGLSRRRESLADATAVELTRDPSGLRAALEKLEGDTTVVSRPSPAVAHLWIESPLERSRGTGMAGTIGRLFDTHPPLRERIETLRSFEGLDPSGRGPVDPYPGRAQ